MSHYYNLTKNEKMELAMGIPGLLISSIILIFFLTAFLSNNGSLSSIFNNYIFICCFIGIVIFILILNIQLVIFLVGKTFYSPYKVIVKENVIIFKRLLSSDKFKRNKINSITYNEKNLTLLIESMEKSKRYRIINLKIPTFFKNNNIEIKVIKRKKMKWESWGRKW